VPQKLLWTCKYVISLKLEKIVFLDAQLENEALGFVASKSIRKRRKA